MWWGLGLCLGGRGGILFGSSKGDGLLGGLIEDGFSFGCGLVV